SNARRCADISSLRDANWRYERAIAANEDLVPDHGLVLVHTVIVAGNRSCADVDARTDLRVSQIRKMIRLRPLAQRDLLGLNKVPHGRAFPDFAAGPQMGVRSNDRAGADAGTFHDAAGTDHDAVPNNRIANDGIGANSAISTNSTLAQQLHIRFDDCIRRNL